MSFAALQALVFAPAYAATIDVPTGASLQHAIDIAAPGDVLQLASGLHQGNVVIPIPLTIQGPQDRSAIVEGDGKSRTIWIKAAGVSIRNLTVRGSGLSLSDMNAAIFVDRTADHALIEQVDILDNLIGVYLWGPRDAIVRDNRIVGRRDLRVSERGNGVQLWNTPGSVVLDNDISEGRDGIFTTTSRQNLFRGNRFKHVRFAVHYMYTNESEVSDNVSIGNDIGYAIMYSNHLKILNNVSINDRDHGFLFNFANNSDISGNVVRHSDKCVFIYNTNMNRFYGNLFEDCAIGIHFTAGSERNRISGNAFIQNRTQVMYVGTRLLDWSVGGRGNYWSDNTAFDLDGNGIADTAYRPNGIMDQVLWRAPAAKLLLNSPATEIVRWAQSQFPAIHPGGVIDSAPLMKPPVIKTVDQLGGRS